MNALTVASKDQFFELLAEEFSRKIAKVEARALADATQLGQRPAPSLSAEKDTP